MVQATTYLNSLRVEPDAVDLVSVCAQNPVSLWGVAPIAPIHLGYDSLILAQRELMATGCQHIILLADYHATLTHGLPTDQAGMRATYYENYFRHCCGLNATFIRGSNFQTRTEYVEALYSAMSGLPVARVKDSLAKVTKAAGADKAMVGSYLYGLMQCLDCCYLGADLVFAEEGQAKIYALLRDFPRLSTHVHARRHATCPPKLFAYAPTGHDLKGKPLNQSSAATRISIHETEESLGEKVRRMFAAPGAQPLQHPQVNAILEVFKYSVFPWRSAPLLVRDRDGVDREYSEYLDFVADYERELLHPGDCKEALVTVLWERLQNIQGVLGSALQAWVDAELARGSTAGVA